MAFFVIGPILTEFLTGNVPLGTLKDPLALIVLGISYGGGALLVRESVKRQGAGMPSVVLLGLVYGMVNEALQSGGYFDPRFYSVLELGLENFGRWQGINVFWATGITIFHACFSITVPIIIIDSIFKVNQRLLNGTGFGLLLVLFVADSAFLRFVSSRMFASQPSPEPLSLAIVIVAMLVFLSAARLFPHSQPSRLECKTRPEILFIVAFACSAMFFFCYLGLPRLFPIVTVDLMLLVGFPLLCAVALLRFPVRSGRGRLALTAGAEGPLIVSAIKAGLVVQAAAATGLLVLAWLTVTMRREESELTG